MERETLARDLMRKEALGLLKRAEKSETMGFTGQAKIYRKHAVRVRDQYGIDDPLLNTIKIEDNKIE